MEGGVKFVTKLKCRVCTTDSGSETILETDRSEEEVEERLLLKDWDDWTLKD